MNEPLMNEPNMDVTNGSMASVFFDLEGTQRILTFLCNARTPGKWDPVTATILDILTAKLQFCLTSSGLIPFRGQAGMVYPYHMMSVKQKEFLREALEKRASYCVCNDSIMFYSAPGDPDKLDHLLVLEALCQKILESKIHDEQKVRVGVCNIILQRIQSVVPISKGVQQRLNAVLFERKN